MEDYRQNNDMKRSCCCNFYKKIKSKNNNKCQSHLALGGITVNMLFGGRRSRMGSAMVPLDRAFLSSFALTILTIPLSVTVSPQFAMRILIWGSNP